MNLLQVLREEGWSIPVADEQEREILAHKLLEVTPLSDAAAVEKLSNQLPSLFASGSGHPKRTRALHFAFGELCDNAVTHSNGTPIYVAAQRYSGRTSGTDACLELAIADSGIGIGEHLRGNPRYAAVTADEEAIALALKRGVTGTREPRGYGFYDVVRGAAEVGRGEMVVHSGDGSAVVPWGAPGKRRRFRRLPFRVPGTCIQVRVFED